MKKPIGVIAVIYSILSAIGFLIESYYLASEQLSALLYFLSLFVTAITLILIWGLYVAYVHIEQLENQMHTLPRQQTVTAPVQPVMPNQPQTAQPDKPAQPVVYADPNYRPVGKDGVGLSQSDIEALKECFPEEYEEYLKNH